MVGKRVNYDFLFRILHSQADDEKCSHTMPPDKSVN